MTSDDIRCVTARRVIAARATVIFAMIADPARQPEWDGNDNLARSASPRVRCLDEVFTMTLTGGSVRENHVVEFEADRLIAWRPAEPGSPPPGHLWRFTLEPLDSRSTAVTHTYDWTQLTDPARFDRARATTPDRLGHSLERLARLVERR